MSESTKRARMHTAEHVLSAVMRIHYGAPRNIELHLGDKKTKCDYLPEQQLAEVDIKKIEQLVNDELSKNHIVSSFFLQRNEARDYDLWKVPADAETIRIYKIGNFDAQPCAGPHVSYTANVGRFHILSHEQKDAGIIRIRFRVEG